jgi:hypothetical protein
MVQPVSLPVVVEEQEEEAVMPMPPVLEPVVPVVRRRFLAHLSPLVAAVAAVSIRHLIQ